MSLLSCKTRLRQIAKAHKRIAVVGVGHALRGDDAVGPRVARHLVSTPNALGIDAGPAPENAGAALRSYVPDAIVVIDAAFLDLPPGSTACLDAAAISGMSASTHTLPLDVIAAFWETEFNCPVYFFGIQPAGTAFDTAMSPQVAAAGRALALALAEALALPFIEVESYTSYDSNL